MLGNIPVPNLSTLLSTATAVTFLYYAGKITHRLYFSPLSSFPGPKLAAATFWYEFYYDVILGGQYTFHIVTLHEKYGPIVRINPHELHVHDLDFYDKLYAGGGKRRHKWHWQSSGFGADLSTFATDLHELHKPRRIALNPFFAMARIRKAQSIIKERADAVLHRIREFQESGEILALNLLFGAYSADVVITYAFGRSSHKIEHPSFDGDFHEASINGGKQVFMTRHFPILLAIIKIIPGKWLQMLNPAMVSFFNMHRDIAVQARALLDAPKPDEGEIKAPTVFHEILYSKLPEHEKSFARLATDGGAIMGAGTVTTAWAATTAVFYLVSNPDCLRKLKDELLAAQAAAAVPETGNTDLPLAVLEKLPYFCAVIQESLRLSYGVVSRLARIAPDEALILHPSERDTKSGGGSCRDNRRNDTPWTIPAGTPVSMSQLLILRDQRVFPSPSTFRPERWLEQPRLDRYQVAFGKGSRICLGKDLALAELYILLAALFLRYGTKCTKYATDAGYLELWDTDITDVECSVDAFVPQPKPDSKGVRFKVHAWE